jgi:Ca2+-binding RTX toxin-like protein
MTLTASEQYLLELMNRARLDPAAEAARMGVDLNAGLAAGTIDTSAKQVLAPNALLEAAATKHSLWELANDIVSHTGAGGSTPKARILAEGYAPSLSGENLALAGLSPGQTLQSALEEMNTSLFNSASSRAFLMNNGLREIGIGAEAGIYTQSGVNFDAEALTLKFGTTGTAHFLTGVAYTDTDKNAFYSIGEGAANVTFTSVGVTSTTAEAGGYALTLGSAVATAVTGSVGALNFSVTVDMSAGNVKLDVINGASFATSGNIVLGAGINAVQLLGVGNLSATGNAAANTLTGTSGLNNLNGLLGNDKLFGLSGNDALNGGFGNDQLAGGKGADQLTGGTGADTFIFGANEGTDRVIDFNRAEGDRLRLDDALWGNVDLRPGAIVDQFAHKGVGEVILNFGIGEEVHLVGLKTLVGLYQAIDIF